MGLHCTFTRAPVACRNMQRRAASIARQARQEVLYVRSPPAPFPCAQAHAGARKRDRLTNGRCSLHVAHRAHPFRPVLAGRAHRFEVEDIPAGRLGFHVVTEVAAFAALQPSVFAEVAQLVEPDEAERYARTCARPCACVDITDACFDLGLNCEIVRIREHAARTLRLQLFHTAVNQEPMLRQGVQRFVVFEGIWIACDRITRGTSGN